MLKNTVSTTLKLIMVIYKLNGCASIDDIMRNLNISRNTAHTYLSILRRKNIIINKYSEEGKILYCLNKYY